MYVNSGSPLAIHSSYTRVVSPGDQRAGVHLYPPPTNKIVPLPHQYLSQEHKNSVMLVELLYINM